MSPRPAYKAFEWITSGRSPWQVSYEAHVDYLGWLGTVYDGATGGTGGQDKNLQALWVRLNSQYPGVSICYEVWVVGPGSSVACDGAQAGTTGQGLPVESFRVWLENAPPGLNVCYTPNFSGTGWESNAAVCNGLWQGGGGTRLQAVSIRLLDERGV